MNQNRLKKFIQFLGQFFAYKNRVSLSKFLSVVYKQSTKMIGHRVIPFELHQKGLPYSMFVYRFRYCAKLCSTVTSASRVMGLSHP